MKHQRLQTTLHVLARYDSIFFLLWKANFCAMFSLPAFISSLFTHFLWPLENPTVPHVKKAHHWQSLSPSQIPCPRMVLLFLNFLILQDKGPPPPHPPTPGNSPSATKRALFYFLSSLQLILPSSSALAFLPASSYAFLTGEFLATAPTLTASAANNARPMSSKLLPYVQGWPLTWASARTCT